MNDFFHSRGFKTILAVAAVMLSLIIYTESAGFSRIAEVLGFVTSPLVQVGSAAVNDAKNAVDSENVDELQEKINKLEEENRAYREMLVDYYEIKNKFAEYESMLGIKEENEDYLMISASVIGRDPNEKFYGFMIDKGYLAELEVGDPVITSDGLIGWVSKVYATTSFVTTILSEETGIGAAAKEKNEIGVIEGNIKFADEGKVKLTYLSPETKVSAGDIITTTGLGGEFPKNLIIGEVVEVSEEMYSFSKYAVIKPYEDIKNVSEVFVIADFYGKGLTASEE